MLKVENRWYISKLGGTLARISGLGADMAGEILGSIHAESLSEGNEIKKIYGLSSQQVPIYGANQMEACATVFECGGEKYVLFTEAVRYEDKWFNNDIGNGIAEVLGISPGLMGTYP